MPSTDDVLRAASAHVAALIAACFLGWVLAMGALAFSGPARGDDALVPPTEAERADIATWIPQTCCWTNNCCFKVKPSALRPVGQDQYEVVASGQVKKRTGWSKDGQTWRCTCDWNGQRWLAHPKADTRCIFPALPNS